MHCLFDEQLTEDAADASNILVRKRGDEIDHILRHRPGAKDPEIPPLCRQLKFDVLVTANIKDFGARKFYFRALIEAGISVIVLRPGRIRFTAEQQMALLSGWFEFVRAQLRKTKEPVLILITPKTVPRVRNLAELDAMIDGDE